MPEAQRWGVILKFFYFFEVSVWHGPGFNKITGYITETVSGVAKCCRNHRSLTISSHLHSICMYVIMFYVM